MHVSKYGVISEITSGLSDDELRGELSRREHERLMAQIPKPKEEFDTSSIIKLTQDYFAQLVVNKPSMGYNWSSYGAYYTPSHSSFHFDLAKVVIVALYGQETWDWLVSKR